MSFWHLVFLIILVWFLLSITVGMITGSMIKKADREIDKALATSNPDLYLLHRAHRSGDDK